MTKIEIRRHISWLKESLADMAIARTSGKLSQVDYAKRKRDIHSAIRELRKEYQCLTSTTHKEQNTFVTSK